MPTRSYTLLCLSTWMLSTLDYVSNVFANVCYRVALYSLHWLDNWAISTDVVQSNVSAMITIHAQVFFFALANGRCQFAIATAMIALVATTSQCTSYLCLPNGYYK